MHMRYALLALLADGEAHGYRLLKEFHRRIGPFWHPNIGQVYQVLHDLAERGLVARRDVRSGTRLRRLFRLTPRGQRALRVWLARRPAWPPPLRDELLIRLLAVEGAGRDALLDQIGRQEAEYRRYLELVREDAGQPSDELTRRLGQEAATSLTEAYLGWLERCRTLLAERTLERALERAS